MWCVDVSDAFESEIETEIETTARRKEKKRKRKKKSRVLAQETHHLDGGYQLKQAKLIGLCAVLSNVPHNPLNVDHIFFFTFTHARPFLLFFQYSCIKVTLTHLQLMSKFFSQHILFLSMFSCRKNTCSILQAYKERHCGTGKAENWFSLRFSLLFIFPVVVCSVAF